MAILVGSVAGSTVSMTVSVTKTQINTAADYSFQINRQFDPSNGGFFPSPPAVPPNSKIVLTFPKEFHTLANSLTLPCFNTATGVALTCQVSTGLRQVTITDYYASTATLSNAQPSFTIRDVINGYKVGLSENFYWEIQNPNGTAIDTGPPVANTYLITGIEFTPGTFKSTPSFRQLLQFLQVGLSSAAFPPSRYPSNPAIPSLRLAKSYSLSQ